MYSQSNMPKRFINSATLLRFSNDLDVHSLKSDGFFEASLLRLFERNFNYSEGSIARFINHDYCGIVSNSVILEDSRAAEIHYSNHFQKDDPYAVAITNLGLKSKKGQPVLVKSSNVLQSPTSEKKYTQYMANLGLRWSLAMPIDGFHIVLDKFHYEEDFTSEEMDFFEEIYLVLYNKFQNHYKIANVIDNQNSRKAVLDDQFIGSIILDKEFAILDYNEYAAFFLSEVMESVSIILGCKKLVAMLFDPKKRHVTNSLSTSICYKDYYISMDARLDTSDSHFGLPFYCLSIQKKSRCVRKNNKHTHVSKVTNLIQKYGISQREIDIIKMIAEGKKYQEIADSLFISISTVRSHVKNIYQKMNINNQRAMLSFYNNIENSEDDRIICGDERARAWG